MNTDPNETPAGARQVGGDHYKGTRYQHWDFAAKANLGYFEGVITKYISRFDKKNGVEDIDKTDHYVEKLLELHDQTGRRCQADHGAHFDAEIYCDSNGYVDERREAIILAVSWRGHSELKKLRDMIANIRRQHTQG